MVGFLNKKFSVTDMHKVVCKSQQPVSFAGYSVGCCQLPQLSTQDVADIQKIDCNTKYPALSTF